MANYAKYTGISSGGGGGGGSGTVTSVGLADGSTVPIFNISGSPVTTSGVLVETLKTQAANKIFAGPTTGGVAQPTFRSLVAADLPISLGNLTDAGTDGITITGGTGAVIGAGTSISQHVADASHNGYLSSVDWSTFNNKQSTGLCLLLSGGTMGGAINMGSHQINAVTDPTSAQDAATKNYVDTKGVKVCVIVDSKASGTDGGAATSGSWITRDLTALTDSNTGITLSSNQMSIPAGTYSIWSTCPFNGVVNRANTRLQNITDSTTILPGSSVASTGGGTSFTSYIMGIFTLSGTKTVELQYQVQTSVAAAQALGFSSGGIFTVVNEIYTQIQIIKLA